MFKRLIFLIAALIGCSVPALSQRAKILGVVTDSFTRRPLEGATVSLAATRLGTSTSSQGTFSLENIPPGTHRLRASHVGYAPHDTSLSVSAGDSIYLEIHLLPVVMESEAMVITGTRTIRDIADVPVRIEAIPQEEVEEKLLMTPSSVAMLLNESTGMRVQTTSATTNTANLRIQGLSGRYTQILIDGIPSFGGLAAGFGLTQLPPLNIRQVEVIKGATSALYGADAISGVVNFLTKEPREQPELSAILNATTQRGFDAAGFYGRKSDDLGFTLFGSYNTQSLFDVDGDGFGDIAEYDRFSFSPKVFYELSNEVSARLSVGFLAENRLGGMVRLDANPLAAAGDLFSQVDDVKTRRLEFSSQIDYKPSPLRSGSVKLAAMRLRRDAVYGRNPFNATQYLLYADAQYSFAASPHNILIGAAFNLEDYRDETPGLLASRSYSFNAPALFAQNELRFSNAWTLLMSGRVDFHNKYGTFFTPRASLMYRPTSMLTLRLGGGTGFKAPTIFTEEAEEAGFRNVRPLLNIGAEEALSASFDVNWRAILGKVAAVFNTALYFTRLKNAIITDEDSLANGIVFLQNATGPTIARGGEFSAKITWREFKLSVGYTYLYASQASHSSTYELELNPRHSFGAVALYENERLQMKVGIENYWTGTQRLERNPFRDRSPAYWITGVMSEKSFGRVRFFINFENIFDTRQTRFEPIIVRSPGFGDIRTLPIYAPLEGRAFNAGIRILV